MPRKTHKRGGKQQHKRRIPKVELSKTRKRLARHKFDTSKYIVIK